MSAVLEFRVPVEHPAFTGHFPGMPMFPGALLLDEALRRALAGEGREPLRILTAKFLEPVRPGDLVRMEYDLQPSGRLGFELQAAGRIVCHGIAQVGQIGHG